MHLSNDPSPLCAIHPTQVNTGKAGELLLAGLILAYVVPELLKGSRPNRATLAKIHWARQALFDAVRGGAHGHL